MKNLSSPNLSSIQPYQIVFPPYPDHDEFEIYAAMNTAKEVGGDFYDFFFIDLITSLSCCRCFRKRIPAALFMMTSKL
jgi:sigma-B regulation protein RsbU (phosphoserine phosphatase)